MRSLVIGATAIVLSAVAANPSHAQEPAPAPAATQAPAQPTSTSRQPTHPDNDRRQVVPFLDATYVAFASSRATVFDPVLQDETELEREVTFEADIVPNFVIRQTFFDVISEENEAVNIARRETPEFRYAWSLVGVPMVRLRMFINDVSSPVRTPSYMPKGTFQAFWFKLGDDDRLNLLSAQATIGHHSNGQDGCLYAEQTRDETDPEQPCLPEVPADGSFRPVNRNDGSFSTNYIQLGFRYRNITLDPKGNETEDRTSSREYTLGFDFELNPTGFLGGGIDEDLRVRYGGNRITLLGGTAWKQRGCARAEVKGFLKHAFSTGEHVPGWAGSGEFQCLFRDTNWGVFARYFAGQDYYNLAFQDNAHRFQFGATYSQEGFLRFRPRREN